MSAATQTVSFVAIIEFRHIDNRGEQAKEFAFNSFEAMLSRFSKERNRRANKDKATGGKYRMVLTAHGKRYLENNPDRVEAHRDAIEGTWFNL